MKPCNKSERWPQLCCLRQNCHSNFAAAGERSYFCDICRNHHHSPIYEAYHQGRLQTKFELRKTVIKLAKAGSPAAEPLADKYMKEQIIND